VKIFQLASGDLWAGAEVQLYHMSTSMAKVEGVELWVILLNHGQLEDELISQGINVIILDEQNYNDVTIAIKLVGLIKRFKPDLIHTHRTKENIIASLVGFVAGIKTVRTVHGAEEFSELPVYSKTKIFSWLNKLTGKFLQQKLIAVSDALRVTLSKDYPDTKLVVINNSVSIPYIETKAKEKIDTYIDSEQVNVAFVGRFVSVKRVDLFYTLAKETINQNKLNIHFYMIGDGPLYETIRQRIVDDNLKSNIHLTGFVKNTAPYLKEMNLLVFTSDHEGLPMTLLEAMTLGVPVLARKNLLTINKVLCNGECGFIELTEQVDNFSNRLLEILTEHDVLKDKFNAARRKIYNEFSIDKNVAQYIRVYNELIHTI